METASTAAKFRILYSIHDIPREDNEPLIRNILQSEFNTDICQRIEGKKWQAFSVDDYSLSLKHDPTARTKDEFVKRLKNSWSAVTSKHNARYMWLHVAPSTLPERVLQTQSHTIVLNGLSLGTFLSTTEYRCHWKSPFCETAIGSEDTEVNGGSDSDDDRTRNQLSATFQHDTELLSVTWKHSNDVQWKMDIAVESLADKVLVISRLDRFVHLFMSLTNLPKLYRGEQYLRSNSDTFWERESSFYNCDYSTFGSCSVLHLKLTAQDPTFSALIHRLESMNYIIYYSNLMMTDAEKSTCDVPWPAFRSFDAAYSWHCLLTRGFKVTDQIQSDEFTELLNKSADNPQIGKVLDAVTTRVDEWLICDVQRAFIDELDKLQATGNKMVNNEVLKPAGTEDEFALVRRLLVTPTTVRGLSAQWCISNRVLRQYGSDRFIRVIIRDEDLVQLSAAYRLHEPVNVITKFLRQDLIIADRRYHFLGCSNSQMREHGLWMYASDGAEGHTVDGIRQWMGDLSAERCVATYMSRLGQFFSASRNTIHVDRDSIEEIPDVTVSQYCFTDGIGKISQMLAKKVSERMGLEYKPSAFQIRLGGCKGVLSVCPSLDYEKIQIRNSMKKFESDHNGLDVVNSTSPGRLHLNRQVIVLMSGLGVPDDAFFRLQEAMLQRLAQMLISEEQAAVALAQMNCGFSKDALLNSGISLTTEPFLRSLLLVVYRQKLGELLRRTRIEIDPNKGRSMIGTVDETGTLEYGQVFVQYSAHVNQPNVNTRVLTETVVIAKNPCFHPGDLRKFQAIDNPALHHMVDCVVFPMKGQRPHPNEMSGSDLDGDAYFVCWQESMIPAKDNEQPMDYTPNEKRRLEREINEKDMIEFFGKYIESDQLGVIANAHLVHADARGIFSQQCLELAQKHSDAVDFLKTGCPVKIPSHLRPRNYPRYMQKRDKPISRSNHVLSALYDQCKAIDSTIRSSHVPLSLQLDKRFIVPGYEQYLDSAKELVQFYRGQMRALMNDYRIDSEVEIFSGLVHPVEQTGCKIQRRDSFETVGLIRRHLKSIKLKTRSMFFEEFDNENTRSDKAIMKTSAIYSEVYESGDDLGISLPWTFCDLLLASRRFKTDISAAPGAEQSPHDSNNQRIARRESLLCVLSKDIAEYSSSRYVDKKLMESRKQRKEALNALRCKVQPKIVDFICFGSTVTEYDHLSSNLDIFININCEDYASNVTQVLSVLREVFPESHQWIKKIPTSACEKPVTVSIGKQDVVLHWSESSLRRTAKIMAVTLKNKWVIPILHIALSWARKKNVCDNRSNSLVTSEQLVLLFVAFLENETVENCRETSWEDVHKAKQLLLASHFLDCEVSQCCHLDDTEQLEQCQEPGEAAVLFQFLRHYSQSRGEVIKCTCDVSYQHDEVKLVQLADPQYGVLAERFLQAYYTLASSSRLTELLQISEGISTRQHRVIQLAREVASIVIFVEKYYQEKLQNVSGATSVRILRKSFRNEMAGLYLDVWGDHKSIQLIEDNVREIEQMSTLFVGNTPSVVRQVIHGSFLSIFENSSGESAELTFYLYNTGICQPSHRNNQADDMLYLPRLVSPSSSDEHSMNIFVDSVMRQVNFLNQSFDETLFGELRAVVTYGTCYVVANPKPTTITVKRFTENMTQQNRSAIAASIPGQIRSGRPGPRTPFGSRRPWCGRTGSHADCRPSMDPVSNFSVRQRGQRGQRGRAGRLRGGTVDRTKSHEHPLWRNAFVPSREFNSEKFETFLKSKGFAYDENYKVYLVTVKLKLSGYQSEISSNLVLNEELELERLTMTDTKWICANVYTDKSFSAEREPNDIRFRIHSRVSLSPEEMNNHWEDCGDLIENHKNLLIFDNESKDDNVVGVNREYSKRIDYVRFKHSRVYKIPEGQQTIPDADWFLRSVRIRENSGREFSLRSDGTVDRGNVNLSEISVVLDLPDRLDADKMHDFLRRTWIFSQELGANLV